MTIHLISFASILHKQATLRSSHEGILSELEKYYTVKLVDYQDMDKLTSDDFKIIFIATGGVERLVIQHFERLPRPAILLADGMQNSLAAALEISTWLRGRGMKSEILHGELPSIIQRVHILYNNFRAQRSLFGKRIGVIGTPSSWLVASNVDYLLAKRRWGIEYIDIPLERVVVEQLMKGPKEDGHYAVLPDTMNVLSVTTSDRIAYVNFDKSFKDSALSSVAEQIPIYAVVDSITANCKVDKVQFSINGESDVTFRETMKLNQFYEEDLSYLEEKDT